MERKRKESSHPNMAEHLICTFCSDTFDDPRNLVCGHAFCKKCLDKLDEKQLGSPLKASICCPTCSRSTRLRGSRVDGLGRNIPIVELLDKDLSKEPGPSCKKPKGTSTCTEHSREHRYMYCTTCLVYICFKCIQAKHSDHVIMTRNDFLGELSQKTDDAKRQYQVQLKTLENNLRGADQGIQELRSAKQSINDEYEAKLQSLIKKTKKWESDVAQFKEKGKQFKKSLAIAVPKLECKTLEDLDGEDLKSYVKNVDNVMNLLKTDIGVKHLNHWSKLLVPSAASRLQTGSVPSSSGGTAARQTPKKGSPKSVNKPL